MVSGSSMKLADHGDEEDSAFVPTSDPAYTPAIDQIPQSYGPSKPKELGLNLHIVGPDTSMAPCRGNSQYIAATA
jgi:hypothetical protein